MAKRGRQKGSRVINGRYYTKEQLREAGLEGAPRRVQMARMAVALPEPAMEASLQEAGLAKLERTIELKTAELEALRMALDLVRG